MRFTFVHTADIHLDSPLRGLGAYSQELADCFREASRLAFTNLVDAVLERQAAFLVIAGDIFDGDWRDYSTGLFFVRQMARLQRAGIPVYALSGNHDAESEITKSLHYPDNVRFFSTRRPETILHEPTGTRLHGQGFSKRWSTENIALNYPLPVSGAFNIGVLHTACEASSDHAPYAPCTLEQLRNHGYQYWALGHVHAHAVLSEDPYVVFPGNLQGRHVRESGAKGYCVVEVTDGEVSFFEHVYCDVARWCDLTVPVCDDECPDLETLLERVRGRIREAAALADGRPLAVRLTLQGTTTLHRALLDNQQELRAQVEAVAFSASSEVMLEKLQIRTSEPSAALPPGDGASDLVAELLQELQSPELTRAVDEELEKTLLLMRAKLPNAEGLLPSEAELLDLMEEARAIVAARLAPAGAVHASV